MKKLFISIILILMLTGCSLFNEDETGFTTYETLTYDEYISKIDANETFVIFLWQTGCSHCETFDPKIKAVIKKYDLEVFSMNLAELSDTEYAKVKNKTFITGTPTTLYIEDGVTQSDKIIGDADKEKIIKFFEKIEYIGE